MRLQAEGHPIAEVELPNAGGAVAALQRCNDDLLRSWGIDPAVSISRRARLLRGTIGFPDYPMRLIEAGVGGTVVSRFTVDTDGHVTSCNTAVSSGNAELDALTCGLIRQRMQYEPALDDNGRPVASVLVRTVRWINPE